MLHILLTILKIIGIILLVIIGLVLLICSCILFVPIRYSARVKYKDKPDICVRITYLFHLISIKYTLIGKDKKTTFKIFGFDFKKKKNRKKRDKSTFKKRKIKEAGSDDIFEEVDSKKYVEPVDRELNKAARENMKVKDEDVEVLPDIHQSENQKAEEKKKESIIQRIKKKIKSIKDKIIYHIKSFYGKIKKIVSSYRSFKEFISDRHTKEAFKLLKMELIKLFKYIKPRKVKGYVNFGFEDPSVTGKVLGGYYMFTKGGFKKLKVNPDFDNKVFETDAFFKGRIRLYYLLYIALKIYMNEDFKHVLERRRTNG